MTELGATPPAALVDPALTAEAASRPSRLRRAGVAAALAVGLAFGAEGCTGNNNGAFDSSIAYYVLVNDQQTSTGAELTFDGCGPGGGIISSFGDIQQTPLSQLEEATLAQATNRACIVTETAAQLGQYNAVEGAIYRQYNGVMTPVYDCGGTKYKYEVDGQQSNQPYVIQSRSYDYAEFQQMVIGIQNDLQDKGVVNGLIPDLNRDFGITPDNNGNLADFVVNYPPDTGPDATDGQGKNATLASNLDTLVDDRMQVGNALSVDPTISYGDGFVVTAFYPAKATAAPTPPATPADCPTSEVISEAPVAPSLTQDKTAVAAGTVVGVLSAESGVVKLT